MKTITCQQCSGPMKKTSISTGNCLGIALALFVFCLGVILCFTGVGIIIGIPLMLVALFMGGKKSKVWKCVDCGSVVNRA